MIGKEMMCIYFLPSSSLIYAIRSTFQLHISNPLSNSLAYRVYMTLHYSKLIRVSSLYNITFHI